MSNFHWLAYNLRTFFFFNSFNIKTKIVIKTREKFDGPKFQRVVCCFLFLWESVLNLLRLLACTVSSSSWVTPHRSPFLSSSKAGPPNFNLLSRSSFWNSGGEPRQLKEKRVELLWQEQRSPHDTCTGELTCMGCWASWGAAELQAFGTNCDGGKSVGCWTSSAPPGSTGSRMLPDGSRPACYLEQWFQLIKFQTKHPAHCVTHHTGC